MRHQLHWSELIGGDVVITMPYLWQQRFNASAVEVRARFDNPVPSAYVNELLERLPDFARAYQPDGMTTVEFDSYGPTVRTLRSFIASYWDLVRTVDDLLLPNPDLKRP
jgi:transaldolase